MRALVLLLLLMLLTGPAAAQRAKTRPAPAKSQHQAAAAHVARGDWKNARVATESALKASGLAPRSSLRKQPRIRIKDPGYNAGGVHYIASGDIVIHPITAHRGSVFARKWGKSSATVRADMKQYARSQRAHALRGKRLDTTNERIWRSARLYAAMIHEVVHGFGPTLARHLRGGGGGAGVGKGIPVEETTTEVISRGVMRDQFGLDMRAMVKRGQIVRMGGAYDGYIVGAANAITDVTGLSHEKALRVLEKASYHYKSQSARLDGPTPIKRFARSIATVHPTKSRASDANGKYVAAIERALESRWENAP